jgi:hypothetical protein
VDFVLAAEQQAELTQVGQLGALVLCNTAGRQEITTAIWPLTFRNQAGQQRQAIVTVTHKKCARVLHR